DSAADSAVHARRFVHEMVELGHVQATDTLENQMPMIRQVGDLTVPRSPRDNVGAPLLASHRLLTRRRLRLRDYLGYQKRHSVTSFRTCPWPGLAAPSAGARSGRSGPRERCR